MIYIASPYSHPDPAVREARYQAACLATADLLRHGLNVFSPFVHIHPLAELGLPSDWAFWQRIDSDILIRCDELLVLMLEGWRDSRGVAAEIGMAYGYGLPVRYVLPECVVELATKRVTLARGPKAVPV